MSRAKLFNMIKSRGEQKNGRNPFDLSNSHVYSQKFGKIDPIKVIHTIPDDYFDISAKDFATSFPLHTAAFVRGRKELSAYFVPYNTIWHNYNQYQATREDPDSVLLKDKGISFEPRIPIYILYLSALELYAGYMFNKYHTSAMVHYDDTTLTDDALNDAIIQAQVQFLDETDYTPFFFDSIGKEQVFRNQFGLWARMVVDDPYTSQIDFTINYSRRYPQFPSPREILCNVVGDYKWCDWIKKLDMLGYGNIYPIIHKLDILIEGYYTDFMAIAEPALSDLTTFRNNISSAFYMAINRLKYMTSATALTLNASDNTYFGTYQYINVYPLFAYNKIFYDIFRNSYYDLNYDVRNYNCDFLETFTLEGSIIKVNQLDARFFDIESHQYKKDMFTGVLPDTQFGAVSQLSIEGTTNDGGFWHTKLQGPSTQTVEYNYDGSSSYLQSATTRETLFHSHNTIQQLDVLALRRAECLQQYKQDLLRAGNRTNDIFKQIYGTTPKSQMDETPYFIEATGNDININPVISTAATGNSVNGSLGDIAARSTISGAPLNFKFSTHDFGCIIFLAYIVPDTYYNSYRIDPHLINLTPEDHMIPELQNIGFESVLGESLSNLQSSTIRQRTVGFAPRYLEFKTDIDQLHGAFVDAFDVAKRDGDLSVGVLPVDYVGSLAHWAVARTDMQLEQTTSLRNFYVSPKVMDNIFLTPVGADYESDHFICLMNINVKSVRQLSEIGLPKFV